MTIRAPTRASTHGGPSTIEESHDLMDQCRAAGGKTSAGGSAVAATGLAGAPKASAGGNAVAATTLTGAPKAVGEDEPKNALVATKNVGTAGLHMGGKEFAKLCKDCGLCDGRHFKNEDVDIIFAKVVQHGRHHIGFDQFKDALRLIAAKRGCKVSELQAMVGDPMDPLSMLPIPTTLNSMTTRVRTRASTPQVAVQVQSMKVLLTGTSAGRAVATSLRMAGGSRALQIML